MTSATEHARAAQGRAVAAALVERFQERRPIRAWSLIATIYGDCIVPRGGELWLGSLLEIMAAFGIGNGVVRTAMSRLAKEGWIERRRVGRESSYRLTARGRREFLAADMRIYAAGPAPWDGTVTIAALPGPAGPERQAQRARLTDEGFVALAPNVLLRLGHGPADDEETPVRFEATAVAGDVRALAASLWPLDPLAEHYHRFCSQFGPIAAALDGAGRLAPLDALIIRLALVHDFRRLVLRDPILPEALLPPEWPGTQARTIAGALYRQLLAPSETWLDRHARNAEGALPPADDRLARRFAATR